MILAAGGDQPTVDHPRGARLADGVGTVAMAAIAFVAMIVSIVAAVKSGRHAGKAAKALEDIADAQTQQSGAVVQQATDERRELARLVTVDAALYMGQKGVTVHNGSSTYTVHDIDFDFPDDDEVVVISARGTYCRHRSRYRSWGRVSQSLSAACFRRLAERIKGRSSEKRESAFGTDGAMIGSGSGTKSLSELTGQGGNDSGSTEATL